MKRVDLLGIGECMLELHDSGTQQLRLGFGGDVLNTLVYAQRSGLSAGFVSVTGGGIYGEWLLEQWQAEGLDCALVRTAGGVEPPMYLIRNDRTGERTFHYWREASPFKHLLADPAFSDRLNAQALQTKWLYLSAITLAMLDDEGRSALLALLERAAGAGVKIVFDPNYRARLWPDVRTARRWVEAAYALATVAMPSLEDEQALCEEAGLTIRGLAERLLAMGVEEVVIKNGEHGCEVHRPGEAVARVPAQPVTTVVDTTSAGDAFNGAYIAARAAGLEVADAAGRGASMAAYVIGYAGAIVPR